MIALFVSLLLLLKVLPMMLLELLLELNQLQIRL
jgi:hypothetical protein